MNLDEVLSTTRRYWDLSGKLPVPYKWWLKCPVCGTETVRIKAWRYHERPESRTTPYRCDVAMKCFGCAHFWMHGVVIPEDMWKRRPMQDHHIGRRGPSIEYHYGKRWLG